MELKRKRKNLKKGLKNKRHLRQELNMKFVVSFHWRVHLRKEPSKRQKAWRKKGWVLFQQASLRGNLH